MYSLSITKYFQVLLYYSVLLLVSWNYCCGIAISDISKILLIFGWIFSANVRQRQARKRRGRGGDALEARVQVFRGCEVEDYNVAVCSLALWMPICKLWRISNTNLAE